MQDNIDYAVSLTVPEIQFINLTRSVENYSAILDQYGAIYHKVDFYWQVGTITKIQGWMLHLSVIAPLLSDILHKVVPLLVAEDITFRIPKDRVTARAILDGNVGSELIGKVITIYPENDSDAIRLAKTFVQLSKEFRGPIITTDVHLGNIVYTCYGRFNPILSIEADAQKDKYIHSQDNVLIKDNAQIPFQLPPGVTWPFGELATPVHVKRKTNLRNIYKPLSILKPDARGDVIKALYLKGLFRVGKCVIKQGKQNMLADDMGRDIRDRLVWQKDLHLQLCGSVPLPGILDLFDENGDTYLVMEFIKGKTLYERLAEINANHKSWFQLSISERTIILDWFTDILSIINLFHQNGFVHRDIAPGNFLIDERNHIVLIDTELAYNLNQGQNKLPFELGTPGFMSPEQEMISIPTIKEDIYGLGALMISIFTGLSAIKFDVKTPELLFQNLSFFINHKAIANLITACLNRDPLLRPNIHQIQTELVQYRRDLETGTSHHSILNQNIDFSSLNNIIKDALGGLSERPMPVSDGIWMSKTIKKNNCVVAAQKDYSPYAGIHTGISGVLYLLAKAEKMKFSIEPNRKCFEQSWKYIRANYTTDLAGIGPGLFSGAAGIALALAEGIDSGLLENTSSSKQLIVACLDIPNDRLDLSEGIVGQGLILLQCSPYLDINISRMLINNVVDKILTSQHKNGSWGMESITKVKPKPMSVGLAHGISGIVWFLLEYYSHYNDNRVLDPISKALSYLVNRTQNLTGLFKHPVYQKILGNSGESGDERTGVILCFIKAYTVLKDSYFKQITEAALNQYPDFIVNNNFSQDGGLAALGEVYLEAWNAFKNDHWKSRAYQIASVFLHTLNYEKMGASYWMIDESTKPSVDLMVGNSGIIHFLLRCMNPEKMGHILLT